jgi:hypothetical protein
MHAYYTLVFRVSRVISSLEKPLDGYRFLRHNSLAIVKNVNAPSIETSQ